MKRILINLQYDGSDFHGWIKQKKALTIQGTLELCIYKICKSKLFRVYGVSKTDAGVHALSQKVIIETNFEFKIESFIRAINKALPKTIYISDAKIVGDNFDLHNVNYKIYKYLIQDNIWNLELNRYSINWNKKPLNKDKLQKIFNLFTGEHDFKFFCGLSDEEIKKKPNCTIRSIDKILVEQQDQLFTIRLQAKGFIRHQIRYIIQAVLMCYINKIEIQTIISMLDGKEKKLPFKAEAKGLTLEEVIFNNN